MYDREALDKLICYLTSLNGKTDKAGLSHSSKERFGLTVERSVFCSEHFAVRFCQAAGLHPSNTVLSLSALRKYDALPFIVCLVTPAENVPLLANATFLSKISHSSQQLRTDNIKGSFNVSDIMRNIGGLENIPHNFEALFSIHESFTFRENLERLVEKTNAIEPKGRRFEPTEREIENITEAPARAARFLRSREYADLRDDLNARVREAQSEIAAAAFIDNVNIRGRIIEYLITSSGGTFRKQIADCLKSKKPLPAFKTEDLLGDFRKNYKNFKTATEIKTKNLFLSSNPKAYNVDKLLRFLAEPESVYMIYIVGIDDKGKISTALCSAFDLRLLRGTAFLYHWAGRNSRGVTQFMGNSLTEVLNDPDNRIDTPTAREHIDKMLSL
ncbi:MAG: hypothetical protein Q8878_07165 [Bacillota bacterium]|nr:hypothetical protein [Bacillota bacterium]